MSKSEYVVRSLKHVTSVDEFTWKKVEGRASKECSLTTSVL
jgi:hypothetical protein